LRSAEQSSQHLFRAVHLTFYKNPPIANIQHSCTKVFVPYGLLEKECNFGFASGFIDWTSAKYKNINAFGSQ